MNSLSVALKRKSIEKVQPILPRTLKVRQPSPSGRTFYENFKPSEVLKQFRKKQLYTYGNLSTEKSLSNLNVQDFVIMKQSRFDDDHHNTQSIQQLLDTKMGSNFATSRTNIGVSNKKSLTKTDQKLTSQKQSLESDSLFKEQNQIDGEKDQSKQENMEENNEDAKEENYDDYVLGDKIEEGDQEQQTEGKTFQKYVTDRAILGPIDSAQSQARADYIKIKNQRKRLQQIKEDQEILSLMQKYQNSKQVLLNQSKKKHETRSILASLSKPSKIQKSCSLPSLKPKRQVQIPEVQEYVQDKSRRNLIGKDVNRQQKFNSSHLLSSLSSAKLGFGRKKIRTICQQDIYEQEMNSLQQIKTKLRSKGITINPNKLTKGLVNIKNELEYDQVVVYPQKQLPSNPIYKKFPL